MVGKQLSCSLGLVALSPGEFESQPVPQAPFMRMVAERREASSEEA